MYYDVVQKYLTFVIIGMFFSSTMLVFENLFAKLTITTNMGGENSMLSFNSNFLFLYILFLLMMIFYSINYNNRNEEVFI